LTVSGLALPGLLALFAHAPASPTQAAVAEYRVGPGDVLEVTVAGRPELARLATVQTTGVIRVRSFSEVSVEGLTPGEIGMKLTELLARHEPARPVVTARVQEYRSQFVWVDGEVKEPGRKVLKGRMRVLDALLQAGGFTPRASGEVLVRRRDGMFADGSVVRRFRLPRTGPTASTIEELERVLRRDDVVTASAGSYVTVTGAVVRPGRYALEGETTTLTAVVSAAGGPTRSAHGRVKVSRRDPSGQSRILRSDLEAIAKGREQDVVLLPDDQIEIDGRLL
jgi:protein involved in polysaccharide export with SLBB domain